MQTEAARNELLLEELATKRLARLNDRRPVSRKQLTAAVKNILARTQQRRVNGSEPFSLTRAVCGLSALKGVAINPKTAEEDAAYVRALTTGSTPGSYMVPVVQADAIISQLAQYSTARAAGCRIWPMSGIDQMNVPVGVSSPTFVWMAQNSRQTSSDLNAAQIPFNLKLQQAFELLPIQLFKSASPQWDVVLEDSFALGLAESEDAAMHASSTLSNAPVALMSQSGITTLNAANNAASGGNLLYADLLAILQKAIDAKVRPPYAWFMAGRTLLRILSLTGTTSNPVLELEGDGTGPMAGRLFGWPVFATASIPINEAVSSGTNQSHLILTNPKSIHIAESGDISLEVSMDFALDAAQVALRIGHKVAFGYQPAASICVLQGVN